MRIKTYWPPDIKAGGHYLSVNEHRELLTMSDNQVALKYNTRNPAKLRKRVIQAIEYWDKKQHG